MGSIGWRGAGALLAMVSLGCSGDSADPGEARGPAGSGTNEVAVARPAELLGADDPDTTAPTLVNVRLQPDPPESGEVIRAVARVEDGEGGYVLQYIWDVAGRTIADENGAIELPDLRKGDRIEVTVTASNSAGISESLSAETEIENTEPTVLDLRIEEKFESEGELAGWEAHVWTRDPDGDDIELEYIWFLNDRLTEVETAVYPTDELKRGDRLRVRVVASDGEDESELAESGTLEVGNTSPVIASQPPRLDATGRFAYELEVTDADGDRNLRFELVEGPRGMTLDRFAGKVTWQPEEDQAGKHRVEVAVEDGNGGRSTQSFLIPIVVKGIEPEPDTDAPPANAR